MTTPTFSLESAGITVDHYVVMGLATCFVKEDGEVQEVTVLEPIPSASLEALMKGIPTSYSQAIATTVGAVLSADGQPQRPETFPDTTSFCNDFAVRVSAAARTYQANPESQTLIPAGTTKTDFNHSTDRKRVLNAQRVVRTEDNVKQHEHTHKVL